MVCTLPRCSAFVRKTLPRVGETRSRLRRTAPLYRIDLGKEVYYALTEEEKRAYLSN